MWLLRHAFILYALGKAINTCNWAWMSTDEFITKRQILQMTVSKGSRNTMKKRDPYQIVTENGTTKDHHDMRSNSEVTNKIICLTQGVSLLHESQTSISCSHNKLVLAPVLFETLPSSSHTYLQVIVIPVRI